MCKFYVSPVDASRDTKVRAQRIMGKVPMQDCSDIVDFKLKKSIFVENSDAHFTVKNSTNQRLGTYASYSVTTE